MSEWKPYSQVIGGVSMYIAGRQKDMSKSLHGGNIEFTGGYSEDRDAVAAVCDRLNRERG